MKKTAQFNFSNQIAHIAVHTTNGQQLITKTWGKGFGWTAEDARHVIEMHRAYVANLQAAEVTASIPIEEKVVASSVNGECLIQSTEAFFSQRHLQASLGTNTSKTQLIQRAKEQVPLLAD